MKTILFVCTGNTCRSPMAAAYFNSKAVRGYKAASAGLAVGYGSALSANAAAALADDGIVAQHTCAQVNAEAVEAAHAVFGVTADHARRLAEIFPGHAEKIRALPINIPDPYGSDVGTYRICYNLIKTAVDKLIGELRANAEPLIVPMGEEHLEQALEIEKTSFSAPWTRGMLRADLTHPSAEYLAALDNDGKLIGYAGMMVIYPECEVHNLAVAPEHRRSGVGSALMEALIGRAAAHGLEGMRLEVRESNAAARGLYSRLGFVECGRRKGYYTSPREDAVLMLLKLKEEQSEM